jgi:hypothetical protein
VTVTIPEAPVGAALTNRHLVDEELWQRLVNRIVKDERMELALAERIMDQALGFLLLCALYRKRSRIRRFLDWVLAFVRWRPQRAQPGYSPSELVDIGWHTFILYTREYAAFCQRVAGRFIHHLPADEPATAFSIRSTPDAGNVDYLRRTVAAMRAWGITVDEPLWLGIHASGCGGNGGGPCTMTCGVD